MPTLKLFILNQHDVTFYMEPENHHNNSVKYETKSLTPPLSQV